MGGTLTTARSQLGMPIRNEYCLEMGKATKLKECLRCMLTVKLGGKQADRGPRIGHFALMVITPDNEIRIGRPACPRPRRERSGRAT